MLAQNGMKPTIPRASKTSANPAPKIWKIHIGSDATRMTPPSVRTIQLPISKATVTKLQAQKFGSCVIPFAPHNGPRQSGLILSRPSNIHAPKEVEERNQQEDESCGLGEECYGGLLFIKNKLTCTRVKWPSLRFPYITGHTGAWKSGVRYMIKFMKNNR